MWTELSVYCKVCDAEIPVSVDALSDDSLVAGARVLAMYVRGHLERDHPEERRG